MEKKNENVTFGPFSSGAVPPAHLVAIFDGPRPRALPVRVNSSTRFGILVVLGDETDERIARLVQSWACWPGVVMRTIYASNCVGTLVKRVLSSGGATIVTGWWQVRTRVWCIIWTYLDGGNGVGKIPPCQCRRCVLGGRNVVPNACVLPCESRSKTTCRRGVQFGCGVGLHAGIYGVLNGLGRIVPSRSGVVGVYRWSRRWVSGIIGVDWASVGLSERI